MRAWPLTDVEAQIPRVPRTARGNPVRLASHAIGKSGVQYGVQRRMRVFQK